MGFGGNGRACAEGPKMGLFEKKRSQISNNNRNNDNNSNKLVITLAFRYNFITHGGQNMARRQAIAADELFETANRLKAEGKEVTALALLDALGGGSLSTIYKHLEVWQASKPTEVITPGDELPAQVLASFTASWRLAAQEAGRQVAEVKEKAKEEIAAALRQFHGALDAIRKLEEESEADAQEMERLTAKQEKTEIAFHDLQKEAAGQKSQVEQLQKLMEKQEKIIEGLRQEAAKAAELMGTVATLQAQNDKLMERIPSAK